MEEVRDDLKPQKKNPIDRSNFISRIFFCWLLPYFVKGFKRELTEDDMYQHRNAHDSGKLGDKLELAWNNQVKRNRNPSFIKALSKMFLVEFLCCLGLAIIASAARLMQPLLMSRLLTLYDENRADQFKNNIYLYSALIILSSVIFMACTHCHVFIVMQIGMKMRVASCSLIYRKALKLNKTALAETTIGQMVNLISNDVSRFDRATIFMHDLVLGPIETIVVMYFIYNNVGWTGLTGAVFLLLSIPAQFYLGKKTSEYRLNVANHTDERVRLMNEIISGIQVIKMYTWEKPFSKLVEIIRLKEIKYIRYTSIIRALMMSSGIVLNTTAVSICIVTYTLTGNVLISSYAFTLTLFYRMLDSITWFFPQAITQYSEMFVSIKRIKQFLLYEEFLLDKKIIRPGLENMNGKECSFETKPTLTLEAVSKNVGIHLKHASARWIKSLLENNVEDITLDVRSSELIAIVGPVGSGKSTLLHVILQELPPLEGSVNVSGILSYASQEPWLFGGSVRQNILFGQKYDKKKYNEVVRVCALERDFTLFPHGDRTLAGERGVTLSGGQRARINLARAVYKDADIYLLDDPLSAVDAHVGKQLFEDCICGYLRSKCVILVTHQLQYLKNVRTIMLLNNGQIEVSGTYEDLKNSESNFTKLLADIEEEDEDVRRKSKMIVKQEEDERENEFQVLAREEKGTGKISWHVYKCYMLAGGHWLKVIFLAGMFVLSGFLYSFTEYFVTFWVNTEQTKHIEENTTSFIKVKFTDTTSNNVSNSSSKWWLEPLFTGDFTPLYYSILFLLIITTTFSRSIAFYKWCVTVSTRMHNNMFNNIVYSPMNFFNTNPSGRILNRFSRDIGVLDETLPMILLDTVQIGLAGLSVSLIIGTLSTWILIPTIAIIILFYYMRVIFLRTSRDIKRVESVTRSPIYTHLTASLQGMTTIRAFGAQELLKIEFDGYQNLHSAAFFMFLGANRTFGFWLDFICVIYAGLVILFLLFVENESYGGNIGLGLTQALGLTGMFQWGMRQWSELENQMTSVERVQEYADLLPESDNDVREPPKFWPQYGKVEFRNMSLSYNADAPPVLKSLNFEIKPKEKVGIVGRTGAGKTSLIQALFRLVEIDGSILIDDVDTKTVSLKKLRSKISIIPQEPVLFSGTLRKNLDPFDEYKDEILWNALEEVELKNAVSDLPAGLESKMAEGGSNFSVGQRQLLCLARAIVRNNKVLVLDEATANVDPHTDGLIQKTIRVKFADCTVLTIAHRLHTIMDSDKVLVMDAGQVGEFGHPHLLLKNENGVFCSLVMQTGKATAKTLKVIAEASYHQQHHEET